LPGNWQALFFGFRKKSAIPAIRTRLLSACIDKSQFSAIFGDFVRLSNVKALYFTIVKKGVLKAFAQASRNSPPDANLRRGA
jgi:hypothetical protein